jgi:uncharacterized protein (TIGR01777 family)
MKRRIVIAGANGFLGRYLASDLLARGDDVVGLVRREGTAPEGVEEVVWDGATLGDWVAALDGADVLINLAGRTVNCRYHARHCAEILESRTASTRILGDAIALAEKPPLLWINSSTLTIYRHAEDGAQDEVNGELGAGFSVEVAKAWEKAFFGARVPGCVRKVALRTSMVLAREPGTVFEVLWRLVRFGLGGKMGDGRQRISWLHIEDFCRAVEWTMEHEEFDGVANLATPEVPTNAEFMAAMREQAGMPIGLPAARWMLAVGARILRTETELVLKSRWGAPRRLLEHGFRFRWPGLAGALEDLAPRRVTELAQIPKKSTSPE